MSGTRLFIGGLSPDLDEASLKQQLSNYGAVLNVDIKDKKDVITGEIVKRFAFATLDGPHASIEKCIYSLNGSTLGGGVISVERAQESFIERLKREREARAAGKTVPRQENKSDNFNSCYSKWNKDFNEDFQPSFNTRTYSNDRDYYNQNNSNENERKQYNFSNTESEDIEPDKSNNAMDVDLMPSFASYSSAWRDEDDDPIDQKPEGKDAGIVHGAPTTPRPAKVPVMRRYDPTRPAPQTEASQAAADAGEENAKATPAVCITKDLVFSGASGTFSLLDMLGGKLDSSNADDKMEGKDEKKLFESSLAEPDSVTPAGELPSSLGQESQASPRKEKSPRKINPAAATTTKIKARKPYVKKQKFFIDAEDACVQDGLAWLYEEISDEAREAFREARPSITSLFVGRQRRAAAERGNKGAASLTHEWWWSGCEEEGSVEPATLVSEVLSGVASAVRTSYVEDTRSKDGAVKRAAISRPTHRGRGRGFTRGRGLPWGGRGRRGAGCVWGGSNERG